MKADKIKFAEVSLEKAFNEINEKDPLKKALVRALREIKENCYCGRNVKKKLIPKRLIEKYKVNNLWIYNLPSSWRLFYSLTTSEQIELIAVVLDWMNHKGYERLFKF
ncbi:hypothetical protein ES705_15141 [subsurface metagenome]